MEMDVSVRDNVKVSVIVLTYNHAKYIRQALDSILMQETDFLFEVLIGDDASTDETADIIREYSEKYPEIIKPILRKQNIGATKNSYELLTSAKGEYLATCEGDDYWTDRNKLQLQVDFLETHKVYIGCAHKFTVVDEDGQTRKNQHISWVRHRERFTLQDFQGVFLPAQPSTFVRRNLFLRPDADYSIVYKAHPMIADRTLMTIFLCHGDFYTMDRVMSCYRQGHTDGSLTTKLYKKDGNHIEMDYRLNQQLEQLASELMHREIVFEERLRDLFARTVFSVLRFRDKRYIQLAKSLLRDSQNPTGMVLSFPVCFIKKTLRRIIKK